MAKKKVKSQEEKARPAPIYGNPEYSEKLDVYSKEKKIEFNELGDSEAAKIGVSKKLRPGQDLDVPGSELDDLDERIGEEDEENNYYSLGGDDHNDLEEDNGE
jgi:hypothetical protein